MKRLLAIVGAMLVVLGLALGGYGAWLAGGTLRSLLFDAATDGEVIGSEQHWLNGGNGRNQMLSRPVVTFTSEDGRRHSFTDPLGATPALENGEKVRVWYDPANPQQARIAGNRLWMSVLGLAQLLGGGLCLLLGVPILLFARFAKRSR